MRYDDWLTHNPHEDEQDAFADWCADNGHDPYNPRIWSMWVAMVEDEIEGRESEQADKILAYRKENPDG